jgi:hypothetical protein
MDVIADPHTLRVCDRMLDGGLETTGLLGSRFYSDIGQELENDMFKFGIRAPFIRKSHEDPGQTYNPTRVEMIVQKALLLALRAVFEPTFLDCSHAYRPERSPHSALKTLKKGLAPATYVIESSNNLGTPSHEVLLALVARKVHCVQTNALLSDLLEKGAVDFGEFSRKKLAPRHVEGGTASLAALLCNIYLHELDVFMQQAMEQKVATTTAPTEKASLSKLAAETDMDTMCLGVQGAFYVRFAGKICVSSILLIFTFYVSLLLCQLCRKRF